MDLIGVELILIFKRYIIMIKQNIICHQFPVLCYLISENMRK